MPRAYYNEIDPYAAAWLRNLIAAGHIAPGDVDERSIEDVTPDDLRGYRQCHFFAGIGVWSHALRRAGWSDDREVWTFSEPCQPFSAAGKRAGTADERYLRPCTHHLVRVRRPAVIFGEQVASKDGLGWFDTLQADMEGEGYALGALDLCAAGFGAPHIRQRLWVIGERLAEPDHAQRRADAAGGDLGDRPNARWAQGAGDAQGRGGAGVLDIAAGGGRARLGGQPEHGEPRQAGQGPVSGFWGDAEWIPCRDGKARPVEPGTFPLAHGAPARVGRLRAYGNAIVAEPAATFIKVFLESEAAGHAPLGLGRLTAAELELLG